MKSYLSHLVGRVVDRLAASLASRLPQSDGAEFQLKTIDRQLQILLAQHWQRVARSGEQMPSFSEVEFSSYSQNGEDGILRMIFSVIGTDTKRVVELCAGDGIECNAANLIINSGWHGLLFDGSKEAIQKGKSFYAQRTNTWRFRRLPPVLVHAWITAENVNQLIEQNGVSGEIDLLSLDMDGSHFWIWKAIKCINPRVVILEYNNRFATHQSVTVPYQASFVGIGSLRLTGWGILVPVCPPLQSWQGIRDVV